MPHPPWRLVALREIVGRLKDDDWARWATDDPSKQPERLDAVRRQRLGVRLPVLPWVDDEGKRRVVVEVQVVAREAHDLGMPHARERDHLQPRERAPSAVLGLHALLQAVNTR